MKNGGSISSAKISSLALPSSDSCRSPLAAYLAGQRLGTKVCCLLQDNEESSDQGSTTVPMQIREH